VFQPGLAKDCVDPPTAGANGSLTSPACQGRNAGYARPTANGRYTAQTQDFGVTATLKF
jgi:hypothetical protein